MTDVKAVVQTSQKSKLDGAQGISKKEFADIKDAWQSRDTSDASRQWLREKKPDLYKALSEGLGHDAFTGLANGTLSRIEDIGARQLLDREAKLDKRPSVSTFNPDNGLPASVGAGEFFGKDGNNTTRQYQTGGNVTRVRDGGLLASVKPEDVATKRAAQDELATTMSGVIGHDVSKPPTAAQAKAYFQKLSDGGYSSDRIKKEYAAFADTFFVHAGPGGGVDWKGGMPDPKNLDGHFNGQPISKDGRRIIDCEGFSAMAEGILGGIKGKGGEPRFDIMHAHSKQHIITGVFEHGSDRRKGFVIDNEQVKQFPPISDKDYNHTTDDTKRMERLVQIYFDNREKGEHMKTKAGRTITDMPNVD